jgi:aerobic-type carbon monoxide dehydrogenase small subunit (CoxS/CutS family)
VQLNVNGADVEVDDRHTTTPLLWVLRDVLGLPGPKFGCGGGFCAACTVLVDGRNVKSCQTAAGRVVGRQVETVEGVSGPVADAVRDAWYRGNVVQCGYCQPGQTLAAMALLGSNPDPDDATIRRWMNGNLCRCGTYPRILHAVQEAASTLAAGERPPPLTAPPEPEVAPLTAGEATVERGTETYPVTVREIQGDERDRIYGEHAAGTRSSPTMRSRRPASERSRCWS